MCNLPKSFNRRIYCSFPESNSNWLVEVFDLNGKLIYSGSHEQNAAISISVPPGFYQVHASSDNQSFITKLIVH
ncbi:MAG: T9SS type A sorting domain-containing protein [Crocinitomicaceae bacterium]|nr:T9SS type A sorting domain-containing protein [Crocinitomicaceae bacterium]